MARCRLRFLLHELDLPLGVMIIGRGADCHLTVNDPLISRRHVRILVGADRVVIEDIDSRNGVLLNGATLRAQTRLRDGDRIRLGSQEFVFLDQAFAGAQPTRRTTGELRLCNRCRLPYPREAPSCPACRVRTDR
jgi:pSer/pThr/pTyr-binding forkhead associated (FHA) protein